MGHWTPTGVEPKDYDDDDEKNLADKRHFFREKLGFFSGKRWIFS